MTTNIQANTRVSKSGNKLRGSLNSTNVTLKLVPSSKTQPIYCTFRQTKSLCSEHSYSSLCHLSPPKTPSEVCEVAQHPSLEQFSTPSPTSRRTRCTIFLPPSKNMVIIRNYAVSSKQRKNKFLCFSLDQMKKSVSNTSRSLCLYLH
jgi:hypothetical protein